MTNVESDIRSSLLAEHWTTIADVIDAGERVANAWPDSSMSDPETVTTPLEHLLRSSGLTEDLLELVGDGMRSVGESPDEKMVPAPPYLTITSSGPICRATIPERGRLVIELELFTVDRNPTRYRFLHPDPETCLKVSVR